MIQLSSKEARRLALVSQGLHRPETFGTGKNAALRCIDQLGYIQIDTISVINRSHHHCFWTRVPSYTPKDLDRLQRDKKILEYWAHAAAYLPMSDYRFCLPYMNAIASGQKHWRHPDHKAMAKVLERIRAEGPLMARDFKPREDENSGWGWNWKPAKIALEQLFIEGKLIVSHRVGFQKVYDLPERALPDDLDTRVPENEEFYRYLINRAIRAHGFVTVQEICYLRKGIKPDVRAIIAEMIVSGELIQVEVEGSQETYYSTEEHIETAVGKRISRRVSLLSPFDNAVIQRKRLSELFGFDFQIECYVPATKRQYGYYCLPIVYGSEFVGRLDPNADRKKGEFMINSLHIEKPIVDEEQFVTALAKSIQQTAAFNECSRIVFSPDRNNKLEQFLAKILGK